MGLAQKMLHTLADNGTANIQHKIGYVAFVIAHQHDCLIKVRVHRLACNQHRPFRLHEHTADVTEHVGLYVSRRQFYLPLLR